jgi:sporulation protein YlmC with PRC-barrel domain
MRRDAAELMALPVYDMDEGREVGKVKDALFDYGAQRLIGLLVRGREDDEVFLPKDCIGWLGTDAVTVHASSTFLAPLDDPIARPLVESGIHLIGTKIVSDTGTALGKVDKILLNADGSVACYRALPGRLGIGRAKDFPPERVRAIGVDAIVVKTEESDRGGTHATPEARVGTAETDQDSPQRTIIYGR